MVYYSCGQERKHTMKNKTLKHYKRKKFFYRFFMRKSPRSGAMFGLAWMSLVSLLIAVAAWFLQQKVPLVGETFLGLATLAVAGITIALYGFLTFAANFYTILRNDLKKSRFWKIPALVSAFSLELAGMFLLPVVLKKRRWLALILLCGCLAAEFFVYIFESPLQKWSCKLIQTFLLFCVLGTSGKEEKISRKTFLLWGGVLFLIAAVSVGDFYFYTQVRQSQSALVKLLQCDISKEAWKKRNDTGFPIDREPMKSFYMAKYNNDLDLSKYKSPQEAQKVLTELRNGYADFFIALDKVLQLSPQRIAYNWVHPGEWVGDLLMPDLDSFRFAARIFILEIRSNYRNKKQLHYYNNAMIKLCEWCLCNESLIAKMLAVNFEIARLDALSYAIGTGTFSQEEIKQLTGKATDWNRQFSEIFASENAMISEAIPAFRNEFGQNMQSSHFDMTLKKRWQYYQKRAPILIRMNLQRDYLFALKHYCKIYALLNQDELSGIEKKKRAELDLEILDTELFLLTKLCMPKSLPHIFIKISEIQDARQMALLAAEVMEYRKQHGKLPEDLSFLPQIPLSKLDHKPLMYEKTREGFRIFSHTDKSEKSDEKNLQYSYLVRLPMVTGTIPQGVSYEK